MNTMKIKKEVENRIKKSPKQNPYVELIKDFSSILIEDKDILEKKGKWNEFLNKNKISLEIGCGSGHFLNTIAEQRPEEGFIGIEIRYKRLVLAADKSSKKSLDNILWIKQRAENINGLFNENELDNIHIYFPDPWPKRKHKKNRLLQKEFFIKLSKILKEDGNIFFKSDHDEYFEFVSDIVKEIPSLQILETSFDLYKEREIEESATEFERLFYNKGKNINYLHMKKADF